MNFINKPELLFSKVLKLNETTVLVCGGSTWQDKLWPRETLTDCEFFTARDSRTQPGPNLAPGSGKRLQLIVYTEYCFSSSHIALMKKSLQV